MSPLTTVLSIQCETIMSEQGSSASVADFAYDRRWIVRSTFFLAVACVWIMFLIVFLLPFDLIVTIVMGAALAVFFIVVGLSPFWTEHSIDAEAIVLRQGWHFRIRIPLQNVKAINFIDEVPKRFGIFVAQSRGTLNITSSNIGLVSLKLRRPQRFASIFWRRADEIVLDVTDREGFRQALEKELVTRASPDRPF
jgi:hypothetical protein